MTPTSPLRVLFLFGGRSSEHEISLRSAEQVIAAVDRARVEPVLVGIGRDGVLRRGELGQPLSEIVAHGAVTADLRALAVDVAFPVLHGPYGEDGRVQGLLDMFDIPYVGSGVLGAAVCMDKVVQKQVLAAGAPEIPQVPWCSVDLRFDAASEAVARASGLRPPLFVKPANMGSSVGVIKVHDRDALAQAVAHAGEFDPRVVIEQGEDVREIELAVLGDGGPDTVVSMPGEIELPRGVWYDYSVKYEQDVAVTRVPARDLAPHVVERLRAYALQAFRTTCCHGLARIDFFVERETGAIWLNELNTLPGFTSISMYPKLMDHAGVSYADLVVRLCELALARRASSAHLRTDRDA